MTVCALLLSQLDFLRDQLTAERKQREGAVYRADAIRDSHNRISKEVKALKKSLAKEQATVKAPPQKKRSW